MKRKCWSEILILSFYFKKNNFINLDISTYYRDRKPGFWSVGSTASTLLQQCIFFSFKCGLLSVDEPNLPWLCLRARSTQGCFYPPQSPGTPGGNADHHWLQMQAQHLGRELCIRPGEQKTKKSVRLIHRASQTLVTWTHQLKFNWEVFPSL